MKSLLLSMFFVMFITDLAFASIDSPNWITHQNQDSLQLQEYLGDVGVVGINLFAFSLTLYKKDYEGLREYLYSLSTTGVLVFSGKSIIGRERPDKSDNKSMPSGHSALSFVGSNFLYQRYGSKYGIPSYLLSSYVAYSRIATKNHYISDVLVGGALGIIMSSIFTSSYHAELNDKQYQINLTPILSKDRIGVFININQ